MSALGIVEPDSMARAKDLLDLAGSPTAIATGVVLVFAKQQLSGNATGIRRWPTLWAGIATFGAIVVTYVLVGVMMPLTIRVVFRNRGGIETRLLVYVLTTVVAIGTAAYATATLVQVIREYIRGRDNWT